ncbi:MAG: sodium:calcium antiporter [Actinobacteria bacterium]|nr:sodium:calcium antiporter [Actinomycetota bacterium]
MGLLAWTGVFLLAAGLVVWAGIRLARAGDEIAERANLSRLLVGMLLMATATSLPEIVTEVAATLDGAPDLAVGNLLGACMANMAALGIIDLLHHHNVWPSVEIGHARVASVAIALMAIVVLAIMHPPGLAVGWVGVETLIVAGTYVAAVVWMRRSPVSRFSNVEMGPVPTGWSSDGQLAVRPAAVRFGLATAVVLVAAPLLARSGEAIAALAGVSQTFVGAALLAVATTLPELVVSLTAVRIGAHDLAVGNLFGSNAFNMFVIVLVDVAHVEGPVLAAVDATQAIAGVGAILLMSLALAALVHGVETRVRRLEPDAVLLLVIYVTLLAAVWTGRPA